MRAASQASGAEVTYWPRSYNSSVPESGRFCRHALAPETVPYPTSMIRLKNMQNTEP